MALFRFFISLVFLSIKCVNSCLLCVVVVSLREQLSNLDQGLTNGNDPINVNYDYCCYLFIHSININHVIAIVAMVITHDYSNLDLHQGPSYNTHCPEGRVGF